MIRHYIDLLKHFLAIQSISTQDEYLEEMEKARHFLKDLFSSIGFASHTLKGEKHDAVFAQKITDKNLPTLLIYGHYDVQPADPIDAWLSPPFTPTIKNGQIFARGATDNKGQVMVHIMAVKKLLESTDKLPINIKFIIEGEEEIGSTSVEFFVKKYGNDLLKTDYLIVSDSEMVEPNRPTIDICLRGLVYSEIFVETASQDLHSGQFGGVAENPAQVLARIITELKDEDNKILIPGFYDDVIPEEKLNLSNHKLFEKSEAEIIKEGQLYKLGGGEKGYTPEARRWFRPTLDINGIISGYTGEGAKTIIPAKASAKISMRLVSNQDPEKIYKNFVELIKKISPPTAKVKVILHDTALPFIASTDHPIFKLMSEVLSKTFGHQTVFSGVGGSIGFIPILSRALNVPCLMVGFGLPGENLHAPNENFSLINYEKGITAMADFYQKLPTIINP